MIQAELTANKAIGLRFGSLVVTRFHSITQAYRIKVVCKCDCGKTSTPQLRSLKSGNTKSCGCLTGNKDSGRITHGLSHSREYCTWDNMLQRCRNPNSTSYKNYGARGITIAPEWENFEIFYAEMGSRPEGMSIDRKDVSKGYNKENCRWATATEQNTINKRLQVKRR